MKGVHREKTQCTQRREKKEGGAPSPRDSVSTWPKLSLSASVLTCVDGNSSVVGGISAQLLEEFQCMQRRQHYHDLSVTGTNSHSEKGKKSNHLKTYTLFLIDS